MSNKDLILKLTAEIESWKEDCEQHARHVTFLCQENRRYREALKDILEDNPYIRVAENALKSTEDAPEDVPEPEVTDAQETGSSSDEDAVEFTAVCPMIDCSFASGASVMIGQPCPDCGRMLVSCPF